MSRYERRGHWRTSKNGTVHWVSGHSVDRDNWQGGGTFPPRSRRWVPSVRAPETSWLRAPAAARWSSTTDEPNATCPVCGGDVWFFRNEYGGCAYFDALGPPWPKHPCMEASLTNEDRLASSFARAWYQRLLIREERLCTTATAVPRLPVGSTAPAPTVGRRLLSRRLGWWFVFAMFLAWCGSLPLSALAYRDLGATWGNHYVIAAPTIVTFGALCYFLIEVEPTPFRGRQLVAVLLAPVFLLGGIVAHLLTCGIGLHLLSAFLVVKARQQRPAEDKGPAASR